MARFELIEEKLAEAQKVIGPTLPVSVRVGRYSDLDARCIAFRPECHRIGVDGRIGAVRASRSLWHEMIHAQQIEKLGSLEAFDRRWHRQMKDAGITRQQLRDENYSSCRYARAPFEEEAERLAKRYQRDVGSLTRPTGRLARAMSGRRRGSGNG